MSLIYQVYLQVLIYYFIYKNLMIICVHFSLPSLHAIFVMSFYFINIFLNSSVFVTIFYQYFKPPHYIVLIEMAKCLLKIFK